MKNKVIMSVAFGVIILVILISIYINKENATTKLPIGSFFISDSVDLLVKNRAILISKLNDNPITIGIYKNRKLITTFKNTWVLNQDLGVFSAFATNVASVGTSNFQSTWNSYWQKYSNIADYKIGYYISFNLTSGEKIEQTILSPSDTAIIYDYMQIYLYDDVHQTPGVWYSHVTNEAYNSNTILSSIKLTGGTKTGEIVAPITLSAFTYNGREDFNNDGKYIGKSIYTIALTK